MKYLKLNDIVPYKSALELSDYVYNIVSKWSWFDRRTLGVQLVSAIDSIGANIAEGFGRYHKKDKIKFYYNSRGSVFESNYWVTQGAKRSLLALKEKEIILNILRKLPLEINSIIKLTSNNLKI